MAGVSKLLPYLIGVVLAVSATGCVDDKELVTLNEAEAKDNLALFEENGPPSYVYVMQQNCLCANTGVWVRVVVEEGLVTSAVTASGDDVETSGTMTDMLQGVVQWTLHDPLKFEATYDPDLGYLLHLVLDPSDLADNEFELTVDCFGEGTGDDICPHEAPAL